MRFPIEGFLYFVRNDRMGGFCSFLRKKILGIFMYFEKRRWKTVGAAMGVFFISL